MEFVDFSDIFILVYKGNNSTLAVHVVFLFRLPSSILQLSPQFLAFGHVWTLQGYSPLRSELSLLSMGT